MTIVVTWMDDKQETYPCEKWEVQDGLLWLSRDAHMEPPFCIPLVNVRVWTMGG